MSSIPEVGNRPQLPVGASTSANQVTEISKLTSVDSNIGSSGDTAASSDTGNFSLIALTKRFLQGITSLISGQSTGNTSLGSIDTKLSSQATAAKQDTGNTSLASIDGKLVAIGSTSSVNSTTTPLNSLATFTGTSELNEYPTVITDVYTDKDGTLYMEFSNDGTNWDSSFNFSVTGGVYEFHRLTKAGRYFRVRFTNTSASNQTYIRLKTYYGNFSQITSPLNAVVQQDADSNVARTIGDEISISSGWFTGFSIVNKAGLSASISTGAVTQDIWELGGAYTGFPSTSGETITVVSSSANDTSAGTGARTLRITGLDANYAVQTEDFTLNGTTPVTGLKTFVRVHTAQVLTSGGSNANFNAGVITIRHTTTTANVFLSMRVGSNQTNSSGYTIPAGYTGYVRNIFCKISAQSGSSSAVDYSIWTQAAAKTNAPRLRRPSSSAYADGFPDTIFGGLTFTEKTDLILRVTYSSTNNVVCSGGYDLILIKN